MKSYIVILLSFFSIQSVISQQVKVVDDYTLFELPHVTVYNQSKSIVVYTDRNGIADLTDFQSNEVLYFDHLTYIDIEILKSDLKFQDYKVAMHKNTEQLNTVVLSASRRKENRNRIAEHIEVVSKNEIQLKSPQTSADLLASIPGVRVQKSQFGGGSPVLRGMEANRVLLVVDGVRMNNAIYRSGHLQNSISISPNILDRTEVIFGPSSVMYGSDALGGVIHFFTKTPSTSEGNHISPSVFSRVGTVNDEFTLEGNVELNFEKFGSFTSFSTSKFGDLTMGKNRTHGFEDWGKVLEFSGNTDKVYNDEALLNKQPSVQKNTGYSQIDFLQKLHIPLADKTTLNLNFQYSKSSEIPRFDKLTEYSNGALKFAEWHYGPQKRLLASAQFGLKPEKKFMEQGTITIAYQNIQESRVQRKFSSLDRSYRYEEVDVFSVNGDFFVPLSKGDQRLLSYGFEATYNDVNSDSFGKSLDVSGTKIIGFTDDFIVQSRYPDGGSNYTSMAGYLNYRQDINSKSTLNTGIRYINTFLNAHWRDATYIQLPDWDIKLRNSAVTATIGYVYKPTGKIQLNGVISSGFRSPNIDDVGKIREKSGLVTVPNINLRPEYAYNAEIGVLKRFNQKKSYLGFNMYYTLLDNYITRAVFDLTTSDIAEEGINPTIVYDGEVATTIANVNKGTSNIMGATFSFYHLVSKHWYINGSITYTKGETLDTKVPVSSIPPVFAGLDLGFKTERFQSGLHWNYSGRKKISDYNLIEGIDNVHQTPVDENDPSGYYGTPSWNILGFNAKLSVNRYISLFATVDNIFGVHYREFASGISAPGRNFSLATNISF
ncbi:MAG: TonB-dependent receptor [Flavobacteriaceae bacterium]|nr:MAG: TonB-dependent receptor [Flavobacteriaceae bacterium]